MHAIATGCRVLSVSASGYYAWRQRSPSARARAEALSSARIAAIYQRSRATYGAPRIHEELLAADIHLGRKRVARLMKAAGLAGVSRRKWVTATVRDRAARVEVKANQVANLFYKEGVSVESLKLLLR